MLDINGVELEVDDQVLYATTHGTLQIGRVVLIKDGVMKVIGKGNKRELTIKDSTKQVMLNLRAYYKRNKRRHA